MREPVSPRATRRNALLAGAGIVATVMLPRAGTAAESPSLSPATAGSASDTVTTKDGTRLYFKEWGPRDGQPVVFSPVWPLNADAWEAQMFFLGAHGYRCIAHYRRGHGRSSQPWNGNDMDTYADDLAELVLKLDLGRAIHVRSEERR